MNRLERGERIDPCRCDVDGLQRNCVLNNGDGRFRMFEFVRHDFLRTAGRLRWRISTATPLEVVLKNRNGPQLRLLKNIMPRLAPAIAFRLQGRKSNRDAIGAR